MKVFDFGLNWQAFSDQRVDAKGLSHAIRSLQLLLQQDTLQGLRFLDIGCGSGLFTIAAYQLGVARAIGIDISPRCIAVSERNRARLAPKSPIIFLQSSALNPESLQLLGMFDIVYAWGSLHHTGAMWEAINNVAKQVAPGGTLVLAIYNKHITSPVWKMIKCFYNQLPRSGQGLMTVLFACIIYMAKFLVTWRNPLDKERGMNFWYDVIDWIGGYPYEYASAQEVEMFVTAQGFQLRHYIPAQVPTGCNEFVFEKTMEIAYHHGHSY